MSDEVTSQPKLVLVDDHELWRRGVRNDLSDDFDIVGEAANAPDAIAVIGDTSPDVVLCDVQMPGGGGLAVVRQCSSISKFVMLTVSEAERDLLECVAAGASGYLLKSTSGEELRVALRRVALGEPVFTPSMAGMVLGEFRRMAKSRSDVQPLSEREREVLQLVARGRAYKEVAVELGITTKTVENHVGNILGKLKLSRKAELIRYALDHGMD